MRARCSRVSTSCSISRATRASVTVRTTSRSTCVRPNGSPRSPHAHATGLQAFVFASSLGAQDKSPVRAARPTARRSVAGRADDRLRTLEARGGAGAAGRPRCRCASPAWAWSSAPTCVPEAISRRCARCKRASPTVCSRSWVASCRSCTSTTPAAHSSCSPRRRRPTATRTSSWPTTCRSQQVVGVAAGRREEAADADERRAVFAPVRAQMPFRLRSMLLPELRVNAQRIRSLGWEPKVSWRDAVTEVAARVPPAGVVRRGAGRVDRRDRRRVGLGVARSRSASRRSRSRLLLVDRDPAGLEEIGERLPHAVPLVADVADPATPSTIVRTIAARGSHVSELFLCAGLGRKGSVGQVDADRELASIDVNLPRTHCDRQRGAARARRRATSDGSCWCRARARSSRSRSSRATAPRVRGCSRSGRRSRRSSRAVACTC